MVTNGGKGESYAGYYVPYIADTFITADDPEYYNLAGISINDPLIGDQTIQQQAQVWPFIDYWSNLLFFNASFVQRLHELHDNCSYASYIDQYFTFPPPREPFPTLPNPYLTGDATCDILTLVYLGALEINPCFDINHITQSCPLGYDPLSAINPGVASRPELGQVYFNRTDVKVAINAPADTDWQRCAAINIFGNGGDDDNFTLRDNSLAPGQTNVLQRVIEFTNNTIIGVGSLRFGPPCKWNFVCITKCHCKFVIE